MRIVSTILAHCIDTYHPQPFSILLDLTAFEGATPEAWKHIERFNAKLTKKPLVAKAIVSKSLHITYFAKQANAALQHSRLGIFSYVSQARSWLEEKI